MKVKAFATFFATIATNICPAQPDTIPAPSRIHYGINTGYIISNGTTRNGLYTHFTMEKEQIFFSIGPVFGEKKNLQHPKHEFYFYDNSFSLNGISVVSQVSPNPKSKIFQSYFHNELALHYYSDKGTTNYVYEPHYMYFSTPVSYKHKQTIIGDYIGWGFKAKLPENFYVNQNIAMGIIHYSTTQKFELSEYNHRLNYFSFDLSLKLGVGYTFMGKQNIREPLLKLRQKYPVMDSLDAIIDADIARITNQHYNDTVDTKKYSFGIDIGAIPIQDFGFDYYGHITIHNGQNKLAFGPIIAYNAEISDNGWLHSFDNRRAVRGFNSIYQRTPLLYRRVEIGFQYDFIYHYYSGRGIKYFYQPNSQYALEKNYSSHAKFIENYVGYALKESLFKGLYLNQSVGFGLVYRSWNIDYQDVNYNIKDNKFTLGVLIKLGIGYRFDYRTAYLKPGKCKVISDSIPSKAIWGISSGILPFIDLGRTVSYLNLTLDKRKNSFESGILLGNIYFDGPGILNQNKYGLTGINLVYKRTPASYSKRFKFYFQNLLCVNYSFFKGSGNVPYQLSAIIKNYKAYQTSVSGYLGYGCKINILNQLYIDQCFGLGMAYQHSAVDFGNGYYIYKDSDVFPALLFKIGVGYRFSKKS